MNPKRKTKKKSSTYWRKKCVVIAKDEAKERDNYTCQYCGRTKAQGWQIHGSHILPEGSNPLMSNEPYNIISLCARCHTGGMWKNSKEPSWHDDPIFFADWFNKKWPGRYAELRAMSEEKKTHVVNWELWYREMKEKVVEVIHKGV